MRKRRRRYGWKTAGAALLGLMSGSIGCQWTGNHPAQDAIDPVAAVTQQGKNDPRNASSGGLQSADASAAVSGEVSGSAGSTDKAGSGSRTQASSRSGTQTVVRASFRGDPDTASPEDKDNYRLAGGPSPFPVGTSAAVPLAEKRDQEKPDKNNKTWNSNNDQGYQVDRTLPSPSAGMATPVIPAPEKALPITLGASLALAGVENPVIGLAEQAIRVSLAEQMQSRLLLLPNVNVGSSIDVHNGPLQASFGGIRKVDRANVLYGLGVSTAAAETVKIPGLWLYTHLGDALFEPLVARQIVVNRRFKATATRNQVLLEVSTAYLALLGSEARLAIVRQSETDFDEVARLTANFAKTGQGRKGDADRRKPTH